MIVTLNEVERTCQKALFGAGVPAGLDDDAAQATAWLESLGISALPALTEALENWTGARSAFAQVETGADAFDTGGRSAVLPGPHVIDMVVARAGKTGSATLRIAALRDPQFLVPCALDYSRTDLSFAIAWDNWAGAKLALGDVTLLGDWTSRQDGPCDVVLECCRGSHCALDISLPVALGSDDLEARHRAALAKGLEVEDAVWKTIARFAHAALVPASAVSRARGAGSMASDNE